MPKHTYERFPWICLEGCISDHQFGLRDPRRLQRLVDVSPLATDRPCDIRSPHTLSPQSDDLGTVEGDRPSLIDPLGLGGLDACALAILDEAKFHLRDHA